MSELCYRDVGEHLDGGQPWEIACPSFVYPCDQPCEFSSGEVPEPILYQYAEPHCGPGDVGRSGCTSMPEPASSLLIVAVITTLVVIRRWRKMR